MAPRVPLIYGTMTIGQQGKSGVRTWDKADAQEILDVFAKHGGSELDTARVYAEGTTEAYLSDLNLHGAAVDTKAHPYEAGAHSAAKLRHSVETSLATLKMAKVRTLYLHWPDRATPFDETLKALDELYKEGKFEQLGLSNFAAWEVAEIAATAKALNLVRPSVYQAMYNGLTRAIEEELVPCLRRWNVRLVVYNPLAGGLLTGKIRREGRANGGLEAGSRFDASSGSKIGQMYQERYFRDAYFDGIEALERASKKHNLSLVEVALRWMQHHSVLNETDGVIIGASSAAQLDVNCTECEKGALPQDVVDAFDLAWRNVKGQGPLYWR